MERKIKKGRYPGQPEWMPDCEMYRYDGVLRYVTPILGDDEVRAAYNKFGEHVISLANIMIGKGKYEPIYEMDFYNPKPYDIIGKWNDGGNTVHIGLACDAIIGGWDNVILITQEMIDNDHVPKTPKEVHDLDSKGQIIWIRKED